VCRLHLSISFVGVCACMYVYCVCADSLLVSALDYGPGGTSSNPGRDNYENYWCYPVSALWAMHTYLCIAIYIFMYRYIHVYVSLYTCLCIAIYMFMYRYIHVYVSLYTCLCIAS